MSKVSTFNDTGRTPQLDPDIVNKLMVTYKLPENVIKAILMSPFEFARNKIVSTEDINELKNFRFPYLGLLVAKKQTKNPIYNKNK